MWMAVGLILIGLAWRIINLAGPSLWLDEAITVRTALQPWPRLLALAKNDFMGLAYLVTLDLWARVFGNHEFALRLPSVFWGMLSLPLTYQVARLFMDRRWAIWALALLAFSPLDVWYAREVYIYSQATLLALVTVYGYVRWRRDGGWPYLLLFAIASILGFYTSYAFLPFWALFTVHFVLQAQRGERDRIVTWLVAQAAVGIAYAPWWPVFVGHVRWVVRDPSRWRGLYVLFQVLDRLGLDMGQGWTGGIQGAGPLLALTLLLVVGIVWQGRRHLLRAYTWLAQPKVVWAWALLPAVAVMAVAGARPVSSIRQLTLISPFLFIGAVMSLSYWKRLGPWLLVALLLVAGALSLRNHLVERKEQWRDVGALLTAQARWTDEVWVHASYTQPALRYYYAGNAPVVPVPMPPSAIKLAQMATSAQRIWLVLGHDEFVDAEGEVKGWLDGQWQLDGTWSFVKLRVHRYRRR